MAAGPVGENRPHRGQGEAGRGACFVAFIEDPAIIEKILTHFGIWPVQARSPPAALAA
jgi:hypothetical protein